MAATAEQKREFQNELKKFKGDIDNITKDISLMRKALRDKPDIKGYILVGIAIEHLKITGNYLAISDVSNEILSIKNESYLNNARKEIYKVLQALEEVVSDDIEATLNDNQDALAEIPLMSPGQKLNILRATKAAIKGMIERFGPNTKWRWSFQELHGRLAVIAKNLTNWRKVEQNKDPRKPDYQTIISLSNFVKEELYHAAQEFKTKYELADNKVDDDLKRIIRLFEARYKIHNHFGEQEEAKRIKTLMEANKELLESINAKDSKKAPAGKKGKKKKKK